MCVPATGAELVQKQGPASLHLEVGKLDQGHPDIRLSEPIRITIRLESGPGLVVEPIQTITTSHDWEQTAKSSPSQILLGPDKVRWEQNFTLFPTRPGELSLEVVPLRHRQARGDAPWSEIAWRPEKIRVVTEIMQPDISELRHNIRPEDLPPLPSWRRLWIGVGVSGLVLVLTLAGLSHYRRRGRPSLAGSDEKAVDDEFARIGLLPLQTAEEVEHFHIRVADALRRFLNIHYGLPALEQTTSELLEAAAGSPALPPEPRALVREILERCDVVKFARVQPDVGQCKELMAKTRTLISAAGKHASPATQEHGTEHP
jgi:hypothetical protein